MSDDARLGIQLDHTELIDLVEDGHAIVEHGGEETELQMRREEWLVARRGIELLQDLQNRKI